MTRRHRRRRSIRHMRGGEYIRYVFKFEIAAKMRADNHVDLIDVDLNNVNIMDNKDKLLEICKKTIKDGVDHGLFPGVRNVIIRHFKDKTFLITAEIDRALNVPPSHQFLKLLDFNIEIDLDIRETIQNESIPRRYFITGVLGEQVRAHPNL